MQEISLGPIRLVIEHRLAGGPTLRVHEQGSGYERLRFDCFETGAHWHLDPAGRDRIQPLASYPDPIDWTLGALRGDLAGLLEEAGLRLDTPLEAQATRDALARAEQAMRNPPLDLDATPLESLRARTGEKWRLYPDDVLPVWVADMDFPVAEPIRRQLRLAASASDVGYPVLPRATGLAELLAQRLERLFGWKVDPHRIELLSDVVQGIFVALEVYAEPGQGVVVQTPIYPPFLSAVRETGRALVENPLLPGSERWEVDLDGLRAALRSDTRILLLCNPHNPTGRAFSRSELEGLAELALQNDLVIVTDEIHAELVLSGAQHIPIATLSPEVEARTLTLTAASKAFSIAGLRCAAAVFGSAELRKRFLGLPRHLRGGLNVFGIAATRAAWLHGDPWLEQVRAKLEENRALLTGLVRERLPGVILQPPEATYLAWLDCRALGLEPDPHAFFLKQAKVGLSDGRSFGRPGEGFVRFNFATTSAVIREAVDRMAKALEQRSA